MENTQAVITTAAQGQAVAAAFNLAELGRRFTAYIETGSAATLATYKAAVKRLLAYFAEQGITRPNREDVRAYRDSLKAQGLKPASVNLYLTGARLFFGWLVTEGAYSENVAEHIKAAKIDYSEGHKKDYFTASQIKDVFSTASGDKITALRDYAILSLMATTGLRCIEIVRANNEDVRLAGDTMALYIQGKGRTEKGAYVKLAPAVEKAIRDYQQARGTAETGAPLFQSASNHSAEDGRLTTRSISRLAKGHFIAAGFNDERHTAHSLRHTAATLNLLNGGTLAETQQLLRHTNINTTMIYQHAIDRASNQSESRIAAAIFG